MHRTYAKDLNLNQPQVTITDRAEIHHITTVLHLGQGDKMQVFNAKGQVADLIIQKITGDGIVAEVKSVKETTTLGPKIILACAIPKNVKFEEIIDKATQLGVDEIIPLQTARTEVLITEDKASVKNARFMKVAVAAVKQSGRGSIPIIHPAMSLKNAFDILPKDAVKLFPSLHDHPMHIREALAKAGSASCLAIFIGPEGDFTPKEVEQAKHAGCMAVTLGSTVLRVDVAALSTIAFARYVLRD